MKVLFLTYDFPFPTTSGGKVRAYNLLKYAVSDEFEIDLFSFSRIKMTAKGEVTGKQIEKIKSLGVNNIITYLRKKVSDPKNISVLFSTDSIFKALYYQKAIEEELISYIQKNKIDILHCESFYTGFYISDALRATGVKIVYGSENIEQLLYKEYIEHKVNSLFKPFYNLQLQRIAQEESAMITHADTSLAITDDECAFMSRNTDKSCYVVPNGVTVKDFPFKIHKKKNTVSLLFVGNFTYFPNIEAMSYFFDNLYEKLPADIRLTIIGKKATQLFSNRDRVVAKDYVEDIREEYAKADVFIFPVKFGGGTNFKILEAMASGLPIVGFPEKIVTTGAKQGTEFLAATSPEEFLQALEKIRKDPQLVTTLTENARKRIEKQYDWPLIGRALQKVWRQVYEG